MKIKKFADYLQESVTRYQKDFGTGLFLPDLPKIELSKLNRPILFYHYLELLEEIKEKFVTDNKYKGFNKIELKIDEEGYLEILQDLIKYSEQLSIYYFHGDDRFNNKNKLYILYGDLDYSIPHEQLTEMVFQTSKNCLLFNPSTTSWVKSKKCTCFINLMKNSAEPYYQWSKRWFQSNSIPLTNSTILPLIEELIVKKVEEDPSLLQREFMKLLLEDLPGLYQNLKEKFPYYVGSIEWGLV